MHIYAAKMAYYSTYKIFNEGQIRSYIKPETLSQGLAEEPAVQRTAPSALLGCMWNTRKAKMS